MKLDSNAIAKRFDIYTPRYHDRTVLLADHKISTHNHITFSKDPTHPGDWYVSGVTARKYPVENLKTKAGSTMKVRPVPLDEMEALEFE